jgi:branched-chain amino acid transport system substrate-binding protein
MQSTLATLTCAAILAGGVQAAGDIPIGLIAELTGDMPAVGASCRNAALMAVEEANAAGGLAVDGDKRPIRLVIEDYAAKAEQASLAAQKLVSEERVLAIVGPNASLGAVPASAIAESSKTVLVTPWSTNPKTTLNARTGKPKRYVFRACYTDPFEGQVLAKFVLNQLKLTKAAVFYDVASEAPKSQAELFRKIYEANGGTVVAFETYTGGDRDFSAQLTKIKNAAPEIVFLPAYYNDVPLVAQQARRLGLTAPFLGSDAWSSPQLIPLAQGAVDGSYFANHYASDIATPEARRFIEVYQTRYGTPPDDIAALTYDAFELLFQAIRAAGKADREAVRDALARITQYDGVTGTMRFPEGSGDPIKSAVILQIKDGKFVWFMNASP